MSELEKYRWDAHNCIHCSNCMWIDHVYMRSYRYAKICPSSERYIFDAYTGKGRFDAALGVMNGKLDFTPKVEDTHREAIQEPQGEVIEVTSEVIFIGRYRSRNEIDLISIVSTTHPIIGKEEPHPPRTQGERSAEQGLMPVLIAG